MVIAAIGTLLSIIGIFLVRTKEDATPEAAARAPWARGVNTSSVLIVAALVRRHLSSWACRHGHLGRHRRRPGRGHRHRQGHRVLHLGLATGRRSASPTTPRPGPATVIIGGLGTGMLSTADPGARRSSSGPSWPICFAADFDMSNVGHGPLRHRHRRRRHALDPRHHPGHRRLRPHRRQRRRQRRDDAARTRRSASAPTPWTPWATPRPPPARASPSARRPSPPWPCSPRTSRRSRSGSSGSARPRSSSPTGSVLETAKADFIGLHALLQRQPDEPAGPRRHLPRLHDGVRLLRPGHDGRRQGGRPHGRRGAAAVQGDRRASWRARPSPTTPAASRSRRAAPRGP